MRHRWIMWLVFGLFILGNLAGCAGGESDDDDKTHQDIVAEDSTVDDTAVNDADEPGDVSTLAFDATGIWVGHWTSAHSMGFGFILLNVEHVGESITGTVFPSESACLLPGVFSGTLKEETVKFTADFGEGQRLILEAEIEDSGARLAGEYRIEAPTALCDGENGRMIVVRD